MPIIKEGSTLPSKLFLAEQIQQLERKAAKKVKLDMYQLMERAGHAVFDSVMAHFPSPQRVLILAGSGNNGGDAFVVARLAQQSGLNVLMYAKDMGQRLSSDSLIAKQGFLSCGGDIFDLASLPSHVNNIKVDLVVDGLLGIGFKGELKEQARDVLKAVNQINAGKLAIDVPSGLCADTGKADEDAFVADATVTFIALKPGLFTGDGPDIRGELIYNCLDIGTAFHKVAGSSCSLLHDKSLEKINKRAQNSHKGCYGHALIIGGGESMPGAAMLAGKAALKSGTGKVTVLCHPKNTSVIASMCPEIMVKGLELTKSNLDVHETLYKSISRADLVILGPGLGQSSWARKLLNLIFCFTELDRKRVIFDADALNFIAEHKVKLKKEFSYFCHSLQKPWVFTPHPLEAARLLSVPILNIQRNRCLNTEKLANEFGVTVVLKGCGTVISDGSEMSINTSGNPGMASAGMGDVLCGVIASSMLNCFGAEESTGLSFCIRKNVETAVFLHGLAGDFTAKTGEIGMIATDVLEALPIAIKKCQ